MARLNSSWHERGLYLFGAIVLAHWCEHLFQAVQATLLPNVAELVAKGRVAELDRVIRRVTAICLALVKFRIILREFMDVRPAAGPSSARA